MVKRTGRYITVYPDQTKTYLNVKDALVNEGFKVIENQIIETRGFSRDSWRYGNVNQRKNKRYGNVYQRKNKKYIFITMSYEYDHIYGIRLAEVE